MEENKNRAKLLTVGIAIVLILIICGISMVIYALNRRSDREASQALQDDIMNYVNTSQEQNVTAQEITKEEEPEETPQEEEVPEAEEEPEEPEQAALPETGEEQAMVVKEEENTQTTTIMEEEAVKQQEAGIEKTTAKWQKEVGEDLAAVEIDLSRQMSEMRGYWEARNMEAVEDLAYLPRYRAASEKLSGTTKYYYFGETDGDKRPSGKGLAMYADNQYYYGEWKNGARSGNGMWIKYYVYDQNANAKDSIYLQHSYSGSWANDLPNGDGAEHYDFIDENLEPEVAYNRNFIGNFKDGLYHGEIYITNYNSEGNTKEWSGTAKNGVWQPFSKADASGQYPVIVDLFNEDNYQWMTEKENKNQGVQGLISAAKAGM